MKKDKGTSEEGTQITGDFEAFEELEEDVPQSPSAEDMPSDEEPIAPEGTGDDLGFGEAEEEIATAHQVHAVGEAKAPPTFADEIAELSPDIPVNLVAVIGRTTTNVGELMKCRIGQVIDLGRPPGETVDIVVNGRLIARGELVEMEGKMGVRIIKMVR